MPGGFAWRFAIEAGFLILLGVGSGYANLRTAVIVAVVAVGWLLVSLIELTVWRAQPRPVGPFVPPLRPEEPDTGSGEVRAEEAAPVPVEPEPAYPLRADASAQPSEEIEAYTRVLSGQPAGAPADERAE